MNQSVPDTQAAPSLATRWAAIELALARDISSGLLQPGGRLPGEHALAERFGVNRHTVRQAIAQLARKGFVHVRPGLGTFVAESAVDYVLGRRTRFSENLGGAGRQARHRYVSSRIESASDTVRRALNLKPAERVLCIVSIGEADGRPITWAEHWFSAKRFAGLDEHFKAGGSISRALAACGIQDFTRLRSTITARLPSREIAHALRQSEQRPALVVEGINIDALRRPIEFGRTWFAGDQVQLVVGDES